MFKIFKGWWNKPSYENASKKRFADEWYAQGGSPEDYIWDVGTDILRRLKKLEEQSNG